MLSFAFQANGKREKKMRAVPESARGHSIQQQSRNADTHLSMRASITNADLLSSTAPQDHTYRKHLQLKEKPFKDTAENGISEGHFPVIPSL